MLRQHYRQQYEEQKMTSEKKKKYLDQKAAKAMKAMKKPMTPEKKKYLECRAKQKALAAKNAKTNESRRHKQGIILVSTAETMRKPSVVAGLIADGIPEDIIRSALEAPAEFLVSRHPNRKKK